MADTANKPAALPGLKLQMPQITTRRAGLVGGAAAGLAIVLWPAPANLTFEAWAVVALVVVMVVWWVTRAIPMPVTALLPLALLPLFGAISLERAAAAYAEPIVFLLFAGFLLCMAITRWRAQERVAAWIVVRGEARPRALVAGLMIASALLSMWVSATVITLALTPIAVATARILTAEGKDPLPLGGAMVLGVAFASTIGSAGTPIGSPANLVAVEFLTRAGHPMSVLAWTAVAAPIILLLLPIAWLALVAPITGGAEEERTRTLERTKAALKDIGPLTVPEKRIAILFGVVGFAWIFRPFLELAPGLTHISDAGIAVLGALACFLIPAGGEAKRPLLEWSDARVMPWGVLILFGGGLCLAAGIDETGLAQWIGESLIGMDLPSLTAFVIAMVAVTILLGEVASNVATLTSLLPILASVAAATGTDLKAVAFPVALAASFAFMLPVATASNAVAFATDLVTLRRMLTVGACLNVAAAAAVVVFALWIIH